MGSRALLRLPDGREEWLSGGDHQFVMAPVVLNDRDRPISELLREDEEGFARSYSAFARMMLFHMMAGEKSLNDLAREGFPVEEHR